MKIMRKFIFAFWAALLLALPASAERREIFTLEIPAQVGAQVRAVRPDGSAWELGKVLLVPTATRYPAFTASRWSVPGSVSATAVNAIHITTAVEKGSGRIVSIVPSETIAPAAGGKASFIVDCHAGWGLFGGWAPLVGDRVRVRRPDGSLRYLSAAQMPRPDETVIITVTEDDSNPYMIDFENRSGGAVTAYYSKGLRAKIAVVVHPFGGSGRFAGGKFQRRSALRANHCGVLCVSTADYGKIGGFQIIPHEHYFSPEMQKMTKKYDEEMDVYFHSPQWMIVESLDDSAMTGRAPLFSGAFTSGAQAREKLWDFWSTYGRKSTVLCRVNNGPWRRFDSVAGKKDGAFKEITHLRIYVPTTREPLAKNKEELKIKILK